ncbi:hypothetical protein pb186bvf_004988 [Paramecium bursaria]
MIQIQTSFQQDLRIIYKITQNLKMNLLYQCCFKFFIFSFFHFFIFLVQFLNINHLVNSGLIFKIQQLTE